MTAGAPVTAPMGRKATAPTRAPSAADPATTARSRLLRAGRRRGQVLVRGRGRRPPPRHGHAPRRAARGRGPKGYQRSDERIREDVNDRLTDDPHIDASEIEVAVSNREVTLTGTVNSRFEKRHAEDLAESISGVTHVQNNLRVQQQADAGMGGTMLSDRDSQAGSGAGMTGTARRRSTSSSTT